MQDYDDKVLSFYQRKPAGSSDDMKTYPWPTQLNTRHMHSDEKYPSCAECGTMFASSYDLQRHIKNGCPMDENSDENDTMSDVNDEDDDRGLTSLINEVWEENQPQFDKKLGQLMEENSNLSKTEAREEVSEMMLPKDLLLKKYKIIFIIFEQLNQSKLHRDIQREVSTLMEKRDIYILKGQFPVFLISIDRSLINCWKLMIVFTRTISGRSLATRKWMNNFYKLFYII